MSKRKQIFSESAGPPAMLPPPALTCQRPETNRRDIVKESVCRVNFHLCKSYFRWTRREWNLKMHFRSRSFLRNVLDIGDSLCYISHVVKRASREFSHPGTPGIGCDSGF